MPLPSVSWILTIKLKQMLPFKDCLRLGIIRLRHWYLTSVLKMDIAETALVSVGARLDKVNPRGIHIGDDTYIASGTRVLAHDYCLKKHGDTRIGRKCLIGADAIILCGVNIGDEVIVGAGSVVTKDVPAHCIVAGNPARIIRQNIQTRRYGQLAQK